jgi:hypothetical protein
MRWRGQGEKNPEGVTHSIILVQIANHPGISTEDLWGYLHSKKDRRLRMKDKNQLYIHLRNIRKKGFISSTRHTREADQKHTLKPGFERFIRLYNFLKGYGFKRDLMASTHYHDYTQLDNFLEKYAVHRLKDNLLKIHEYIAPNERIDDSSLFSLFLVKDEDRPGFPENYGQLITTLRNHNVDDLIPIIKDTMQRNSPGTIIGPRYLSFQALHTINKVEEEALQAMLRERPTVCDFLINTHHYDPTFLSNVAVRLLNTLSIEEGPLKATMEHAEDGAEPEYFSVLDLAYEYKDPYEKKETPLYQIIKSLALWDRVSGKIQIPSLIK